jgi:hypothetical protein
MKTVGSGFLSKNKLSNRIKQEPLDDLDSIIPLRMPQVMEAQGREMKAEHNILHEGTMSPARQKAKETGPDYSILEKDLMSPSKLSSGISESRLKAKAIAMLRNMKKYITKE